MPSVEAMSATKPTGGKAASENAQSIKVLDELMSKLSVSKSQYETNAATRNLATFINGPIEEADAPTK
jgi:elongation factor 3